MLNDTIIVNGQALTIVGVAPRGFAGTTLGSEPKVFVPLTMRGLMSPGLEGIRQPPELLGVPVRAPEAGRHDRAGARSAQQLYRPIINDVEAPLQKGMSDQTMARFKAKVDRRRAGLPRTELDPSRSQDAADLPA